MENRADVHGDVMITIPRPHSHSGWPQDREPQPSFVVQCSETGTDSRTEIDVAPTDCMGPRSAEEALPQNTEGQRLSRKGNRRHGGHRRGHAKRGHQHPASARRSEIDKTRTKSATGERNCRICMDGVTSRDMATGRAMHLGCKCCDGLDVVHFECAQKWFRIKRSAVCEVCENEAQNLPKELKDELRAMAEAADAVRVEETRNQMRILARSRRENLLRMDQMHLCTYTTFCLLPAALSAIIMVVIYYELLDMDVIPTMILAILVSSSTMLHWLAEPNKPYLHICFVVFFLLTIMGTTLYFLEVHGWETLAASIIGGIIGGIFSTGIYAATRTLYTLWFYDKPQERDSDALGATEQSPTSPANTQQSECAGV